MKTLLKEICEIDGISGSEDAVREYIIKKIAPHCGYSIDNLGNVIAFKKGKNTPKNKLMICAHMDEVGMIVTYINKDGTLKVAPVGGVDPRVVFGRQFIVGEKKLVGVIGSKAVHMMKDDEKGKALPFDKMCVDIGAKDKEDAEKYVSLGDQVTFKSDFLEFGEGMIKAKALDDRAGCAIMIDMIEKELEFDTYFAFMVQEEVGLRGSTVATYTVNPDVAIVLETTTAADIPSASNEKKVCIVGKGAVVSYMDRSTIYNKELYNLAFETAKENNIPCQTKTMVAGGNDSGAIHKSRGGVKTLAISVPTRYLHSASNVFSYDDFIATYNLAEKMAEKLCNL